MVKIRFLTFRSYSSLTSAIVSYSYKCLLFYVVHLLKIYLEVDNRILRAGENRCSLQKGLLCQHSAKEGGSRFTLFSSLFLIGFWLLERQQLPGVQAHRNRAVLSGAQEGLTWGWLWTTRGISPQLP